MPLLGWVVGEAFEATSEVSTTGSPSSFVMLGGRMAFEALSKGSLRKSPSWPWLGLLTAAFATSTMLRRPG